jgi:hypothetical protein
VEGAEILLACAQIAVAFAGFASIVVLFQHRDPARWPGYVVVRLRTMIDVSLAAMSLSIFPFVPHHAGLAPATTWRLSSAALLVCGSLLSFLVYRRSQPFLVGGGLSPAFTALAALAAAATLLAQLANLIGCPFAPSFVLYLGGVLWLIVFAGLMFVRLVVLRM